MAKRVVVTGLGVITPLGLGKEAFFEALVAGQSGVDRITLFDAEEFPVRIAAEVKGFEPTDSIDAKRARRMDRFAQFAVAAAVMAVEDADLDLDQISRSRIGVIVGSGIGGLRTLEDQHEILLKKTPRRVSPFVVPMMISDMAAGQISIELGVTGPNWGVVSACSSGAHAIGEAFEVLRRGAADMMITGGAEAPVTPLSLAGFASARALSQRNEEPTKASRPFDVNRDGFVIGEGAGIVLLEVLESALSRGAPIYCEVVGYGATADAYHITAPDPQGTGAAQAMALALKEANMQAEAVDYINAHGTSTPLGDEFETLAIKDVFGEHSYRLAVSSTKSMTGHLLGAAGGIEFVAAALTIKDGIVPPTVNLDQPDPLCDLDYVPHEAQRREVSVALSNSLGFGGHNASLLIKQFD